MLLLRMGCSQITKGFYHCIMIFFFREFKMGYNIICVLCLGQFGSLNGRPMDNTLFMGEEDGP
jgi:hypothetical protein